MLLLRLEGIGLCLQLRLLCIGLRLRSLCLLDLEVARRQLNSISLDASGRHVCVVGFGLGP